MSPLRCWIPVLLALALAPALPASAGAPPAPAAPAEARPADSVLSWTDAYWRQQLVFAAAGQKLGKGGGNPGGGHGEVIMNGMGYIRTPPPPADWAAPEFDDGAWPRLRRPNSGWELRNVTTRTMYLRGRFVVPDPARVPADLKLELAYCGGAAVLVNGQELGRGNLTKDKLTWDVFAEDYPKEAYPVADYPKGHWAGGYFGRTPTASIPAPRRLELAVPRAALRKGVNVLAVELHPAVPPLPYGLGYHAPCWQQLCMYGLELHAPAGGVEPEKRPPGLELWAADIHDRMVSTDWGPAGGAGRLAMVGARGGAYSGQAVAGASSELRDLSAAVGDLAGEGGARIPASAVAVRYAVAFPLNGPWPYGYKPDTWSASWPPTLLVRRYGSLPAAAHENSRLGTAYGGFSSPAASSFFRLSPRPPGSVPAGSCQPVWVTVRVPRDARPGFYKGELAVSGGGAKRTLPVELEVVDFALPDPKEYVFHAGIQESPYDVANHYKVQPWSREHLEKLRPSLKLLGAMGGKVLAVSVLPRSELGNKESMIPWKRKAGGGYDYDFTILDRYLEVAIEEMGRPRVMIFHVTGTNDRPGASDPVAPAAVTVGENGSAETLVLPEAGTSEAAALWKPFVAALKGHLAAKGLDQAMVWGMCTDRLTDRFVKTAAMLAEIDPGIGWYRVSHYGSQFGDKGGYGSAAADAFKGAKVTYFENGGVAPRPLFDAKDGKPLRNCGWKHPSLVACHPRYINPAVVLDNYAPPYSMRCAPESGICLGARGIGRVGLDIWGAGHSQGATFAKSSLWIKVWNLTLPGESGAEATQIYEAMREGIQEAETRIAIEKVLEAGRSDAGADKVLADRLAPLYVRCQVDPQTNWPAEYHGGWQERSRMLYRTAARLCR